jgi:hypothetical protein
MKKIITIAFGLFLLLMLIGLNSCSVNKRLYQPGYHVEWHKSNKNHKTHQENEKLAQDHKKEQQEVTYKNQSVKKPDYKQAEISQDYEPTYALNDENANNLEIISLSKQKQSLFTDTKQAVPDTIKYVVNKDDPDSAKSAENQKETHWAAITGFILAIISLIGIPLAFTGVLGIFTGPLGILAAIFSRIGMKRIKANPEKYKGANIAKAGYIMGIISIIIFILSIVLFILYFYFVLVV